MARSIKDLLNEIGLGKYIAPFIENEIDLEAASYLSDQDLKELGLPMGPRRKFLAAVAGLIDDPKSASQVIDASNATRRVERRQLTVVFCDLVGSTKLSRSLDPEDLRELMGRYQETVAACVANYQGYVAQFLGDGVLAYFGWPQAFEDQAERGVRAGLDAVAQVRELLMDGGSPLSARVGIASGQVVVGDLLGEFKRDAQTASGETPNLAARLQGLAAPGEIVIDSITRRLLASTFKLKDLGPQQLKGFAEPEYAWQVLRDGDATDRFEASRTYSLSKLVGRDVELGLVIDRWKQVQAGSGHVVTLLGEAGYGKSRMVRAIRAAIEDDIHAQTTYQCSPLHMNTPLHPVVRQLGHAAAFDDADRPIEKRDKLARLLDQTTADPPTAVHVLGAMMSLPPDESRGSLNLDPGQLRTLTISTLVDHVSSLASTRPLLMVLEDAHWIDPSTEEFVSELIAHIASMPILVLITQRPEYRAPWSGDVHLTTLALNRLAPKQSEDVVRSIAGDRMDGEILGQIIGRAGGVPLYLEELTKSVLESNSGDNPMDRLDVPESLQASLLARLDRIGDAKEIAQVGAVIGREFDYNLLMNVVDLPAEQVEQAVKRLVGSELVHQRGSAPNLRFSFKHALIQDAAYDSLLLSRRRDLHRKLVAVIAQAADHSKDENIEALAYHARRGELWDKALEYCRRAGKRANERSAHHEALRFMDAGLEAATLQEQNRHVSEQVLEIYMNLRPSLGGFGLYERLLDVLSKANSLAQTIGDEKTATLANTVKSHVLFHSGKIAEGLRTNESSVVSARAVNDSGILVAATQNLAMGYFFRGQFEKAIATSREFIADVTQQHRHKNLGTTGISSVNWLGNLCGMYSAIGNFVEAEKCINESLDIAAEVNRPFDTCMATQWQGHYFLCRGYISDAVRTLEKTRTLVEQHDLDFIRAWALGWYGESLMMDGRISEAEEALLVANSVAEKRGLELTRIWGLIRFAYIKLQQSDVTGGLDYSSEALAAARRAGTQWLEVMAQRQLANSKSMSGDIGGADAAFGAAVSMAETLGARPELARCLNDYGKHLDASGRTLNADPAYERAQQIVDNLGMATHLVNRPEP